MQTVYKYKLGGFGDTTILMPKGASIVNCKIQDDVFYIWAIVNPSFPVEERSFTVIGTGWEVEDNMRYISTVHSDAPYVWHIFEVL